MASNNSDFNDYLNKIIDKSKDVNFKNVAITMSKYLGTKKNAFVVNLEDILTTIRYSRGYSIESLHTKFVDNIDYIYNTSRRKHEYYLKVSTVVKLFNISKKAIKVNTNTHYDKLVEIYNDYLAFKKQQKLWNMTIFNKGMFCLVNKKTNECKPTYSKNMRNRVLELLKNEYKEFVLDYVIITDNNVEIKRKMKKFLEEFAKRVRGNDLYKYDNYESIMNLYELTDQLCDRHINESTDVSDVDTNINTEKNSVSDIKSSCAETDDILPQFEYKMDYLLANPEIYLDALQMQSTLEMSVQNPIACA